MKKFVIFLFMILLSSSSLMVYAEVKQPEWQEFCPKKYLNAEYKEDYYSIPKNALLIASIIGIPFHIKIYYRHLEQQRINYWAIMHKSFDRNIKICKLQEDINKQNICFLNLADKLENEIYSDKVEAEQSQQQSLINAGNALNRSIEVQQINNSLHNINNNINQLRY